MKSKTKISKQTKRKTNPKLVETLFLAKKQNAWKKVAEILSGPRRKNKNINLKDLNEKIKEGEKTVVPGKVLSLGEINKKAEIAAFSFSKSAKEKLIKAGCKISSISDEIKKNPEGKSIRILK